MPHLKKGSKGSSQQAQKERNAARRLRRASQGSQPLVGAGAAPADTSTAMDTSASTLGAAAAAGTTTGRKGAGLRLTTGIAGSLPLPCVARG